jgi:hypothetical protein
MFRAGARAQQAQTCAGLEAEKPKQTTGVTASVLARTIQKTSMLSEDVYCIHPCITNLVQTCDNSKSIHSPFPRKRLHPPEEYYCIMSDEYYMSTCAFRH